MRLSFHGAVRSVTGRRQALSLAAAIQAEHPKIEVIVPHIGSSYEV